jgi:hypothetical protein
MDFTLVYWDTTLKAASQSNKRNWEKHHIRRHFSSQLEQLWKVSPNLRWFDYGEQQKEAYAKQYERGGVEFVPLVMETLGLVCDLQITLLRPGTPGKIVSDGGDIDNRIKVLLDALRVPKNTDEMDLKTGETNPKRIYCLMEDDKLITSIKVTTDRLLVPETDEPSEACVFVQVLVRGISPATPYEFRGI